MSNDFGLGRAVFSMAWLGASVMLASGAHALTLQPAVSSHFVDASADLYGQANDVLVTDSDLVFVFTPPPFDESVSASVVGALGGVADASASLQTQFLSDRITVVGAVNASDTSAGFPS